MDYRSQCYSLRDSPCGRGEKLIESVAIRSTFQKVLKKTANSKCRRSSCGKVVMAVADSGICRYYETYRIAFLYDLIQAELHHQAVLKIPEPLLKISALRSTKSLESVARCDVDLVRVRVAIPRPFQIDLDRFKA